MRDRYEISERGSLYRIYRYDDHGTCRIVYACTDRDDAEAYVQLMIDTEETK